MAVERTTTFSRNLYEQSGGQQNTTFSTLGNEEDLLGQICQTFAINILLSIVFGEPLAVLPQAAVKFLTDFL